MSTATAPCLTVADFLDDVARIMVDEHGHDSVTVYGDYLTFEGYILDVEFWGHPSVPTPAPVMWSVRLEDDDEHELEFKGEPGASPDDAASMLELALATLY
jgi:hypothetical protein